MKNLITILILLISALLLNADNGKNQKHTLNELSWLSGNWAGKEWGGNIEEYWSQPSGKTMVGIFRLVINDTTKVLELLTIEETTDDLVLRFKHFDPALKSWEDDALIFNLKEMGERKVIFESKIQSRPKRMTYHEVAADFLVVTVESEVDGKTSSFQTHKKRVK